MMPRYLYSLTNGMPFICSTTDLGVLPSALIRKMADFPALISMPVSCDHTFSWLHALAKPAWFGAWTTKSSAKARHVFRSLFKLHTRSFMKSTNRIGDKRLPCGTPMLFYTYSWSTLSAVSTSRLAIAFTSSWSTPLSINYLSRSSLSTLSNAFLRSTNKRYCPGLFRTDTFFFLKSICYSLALLMRFSSSPIFCAVHLFAWKPLYLGWIRHSFSI